MNDDITKPIDPNLIRKALSPYEQSLEDARKIAEQKMNDSQAILDRAKAGEARTERLRKWMETAPEVTQSELDTLPKAPGYHGPDADSTLGNRYTQAEANALSKGLSTSNKMGALKKIAGKVAGTGLRVLGAAAGAIPEDVSEDLYLSPEEEAFYKNKMKTESEAAKAQSLQRDEDTRGGASYIKSILNKGTR